MFQCRGSFTTPKEECKLEKTFKDLENIYREREENKKTLDEEKKVVDDGIREYVERDSLVILADVSGLADRSLSFVNFMTTCRKSGYNLIYVFNETAASSLQWKAILSQAQIFCIFSSPVNLIINNLVKFANQTKIRYVIRQQIWLTKLFMELSGKTGNTSLCLDNCPHVIGAGKYRSNVENPNKQQCYLYLDVSDKLFNTFISRLTNGQHASNRVYNQKAGQNHEVRIHTSNQSEER